MTRLDTAPALTLPNDLHLVDGANRPNSFHSIYDPKIQTLRVQARRAGVPFSIEPEDAVDILKQSYTEWGQKLENPLTQSEIESISRVLEAWLIREMRRAPQP